MPFTIQDIAKITNSISAPEDGVAASFNKCETDQAKRIFEINMMHLILHGWNMAFEAKLHIRPFFTEKIKPMFTAPATQFFQGRADLGTSFQPLQVFFVRYSLFRELFQLYKNKNIQFANETDIAGMNAWFIQTNNFLHKEFERLISGNNPQLKVGYKNITSLRRLQLAAGKFNPYVRLAGLAALLAVVSYGFNIDDSKYKQELTIAALAIFIIAACYFAHKAAAYNTNSNLLSGEYIITESDINTLFPVPVAQARMLQRN